MVFATVGSADVASDAVCLWRILLNLQKQSGFSNFENRMAPPFHSPSDAKSLGNRNSPSHAKGPRGYFQARRGLASFIFRKIDLI